MRFCFAEKKKIFRKGVNKLKACFELIFRVFLFSHSVFIWNFSCGCCIVVDVAVGDKYKPKREFN